MVIDKLKELGFTEFEFLRKEQRDNNFRLTWTGVLEERLLTVRVVEKEGVWHIDFLRLDGDDQNVILSKYITPNPTFESVLNLVQKIG